MYYSEKICGWFTLFHSLIEDKLNARSRYRLRQECWHLLKENLVKCDKYYSEEQIQLKQSWPYSGVWREKQTSAEGGQILVFLQFQEHFLRLSRFWKIQNFKVRLRLNSDKFKILQKHSDLIMKSRFRDTFAQNVSFDFLLLFQTCWPCSGDYLMASFHT